MVFHATNPSVLMLSYKFKEPISFLIEEFRKARETKHLADDAPQSASKVSQCLVKTEFRRTQASSGRQHVVTLGYLFFLDSH